MTFRYMLCLFALTVASAQANDTVVLTADHMIDVVTGRLVERPQITIDNGRISGIASQGAAIPEGAPAYRSEGHDVAAGPD